MSVRTPKYRLHAASGQARVQISGRRIYLDKYGTAESKEMYRQIVAEWLQGGQHIARPAVASSVHSDLTIVELMFAYVRFAHTYYVKDGKAARETEALKFALRPLRKLYAHERAATFGPLALKTVQQVMIENDHSRNYINGNIGRIKRMFRWAVENELVPATVSHALGAVAGLKGAYAGTRNRPDSSGQRRAGQGDASVVIQRRGCHG